VTPEQNLAALGLVLPAVSAPAGNYANAVQTGTLLYLSGKAPPPVGGKLPKGRIGAEFSTADGAAFARGAATELLAAARQHLGSLDRIVRAVELQGFLNATPDFEDHAKVLDGSSELLVAVFGEGGRHARSVLGASSLRSGVPLVLRAVFEVRS
jgi:enamine deaminase RidA (YjgF/YER057c/UK114 family)